MSSSLSLIKCPNCSLEQCNYDYDCRTHEKYIICLECGYSYSRQIRRDKDGEFILRDVAAGIRFDNFFYDEDYVSNPYGAYEIKFHRGCSIGSIEDEEDYQKFVQWCNNTTKDDIKYIIISRFVNGEFHKDTLYSSDL
jgi:hypothetical protein